MYARALESLALQMQSVVVSEPAADKLALRSAALRLAHAANEGIAALVSVIVQSARLDALASVRGYVEPKDPKLVE